MPYVIAEPCIDVMDRACTKVCPVDCIYEAPELRMLVIHPDECIDCGACVAECPVDAIFEDADMPEEWTQYIQINADYFNK